MKGAPQPRIRPDDVAGYRTWVEAFDPWHANGSRIISSPEMSSEQGPSFTLVLLPDASQMSPTHTLTFTSLMAQTYQRWELWTPSGYHVRENDARMRVRRIEQSDTTAKWFNTILDDATGDYLLPMPASLVLPPHALSAFADAIASSDAPDLVYSDEDALDGAGLRMAPRFKTNWDPELMLGRNVVGQLVAYRTDRLRAVGGADPGLTSSEAVLLDLSLRTAAMPDSRPVCHIPLVLCSTPSDLRQAQALDASTARRVVAEHLIRLGRQEAEVVAADRAPAWNRVQWPIPAPPPLVTVVIPTRDQPTLLSRCVEGVLARTDYAALEVLIVDNGSVRPEALHVLRELAQDHRVRVLRYDVPFNFSVLNNLAVQQAAGSVIVLMNDDTEVIDDGWLRELVSQAVRPEVGIVGARLLYPDGRVQHAGIVMESGGPHHQFRLCNGTELGPSGELALTRSVSGVTAACMAIRRSVFDEVGGLDEQFAVAFGDIDICLRVAERGYRIICTPFAELYHHESASRGYEDNPVKQQRFAGEVALLRQRWGTELWTDAYANPNLLFGWAATGTWGLPRPSSHPRTNRARPSATSSRLTKAVRRVGHLLRGFATPVIPNPLFSAEWYLAHYPEVATYRLGPYRHFRRHGVKDGRNPNRLFDTLWYLEQYPDVAASGMNPVDHYLRYGAAEGRDPSPGFSTRRYLAEHPDVASTGMNPLEHYLCCGGGGRAYR